MMVCETEVMLVDELRSADGVLNPSVTPSPMNGSRSPLLFRGTAWQPPLLEALCLIPTCSDDHIILVMVRSGILRLFCIVIATAMSSESDFSTDWRKGGIVEQPQILHYSVDSCLAGGTG